MIKVIFLDFDGTLFNTHGIVIKSIIKVIDEFNYEVDKSELLGLIGERLEIIYKKIGANPGHIDSMIEKFYDEKDKFKEIKPSVPLSPLKTLSKKVSLIIISNTETNSIKKILKKFKYENIFKEIYGADKFSSKDKKIKELIKKIKIKPIEAIYVGDRFSDVKTAKKVGCISVAINNKYSWSDLKTIKEEYPDYIIKDFKELKNLVDIIKKNSNL